MFFNNWIHLQQRFHVLRIWRPFHDKCIIVAEKWLFRRVFLNSRLAKYSAVAFEIVFVFLDVTASCSAELSFSLFLTTFSFDCGGFFGFFLSSQLIRYSFKTSATLWYPKSLARFSGQWTYCCRTVAHWFDGSIRLYESKCFTVWKFTWNGQVHYKSEK